MSNRPKINTNLFHIFALVDIVLTYIENVFGLGVYLTWRSIVMIMIPKIVKIMMTNLMMLPFAEFFEDVTF